MQKGLNKVMLIGNLGADPDMRQTGQGVDVANFNIATSEVWKDKNSGESKEKTEWHRIVVFGKPAEIIGKYAKKGSKLYVEGKNQTRKWTDKDGVDRYTTEVLCNEIQLLGDGGRAAADSGAGQQNAPSQAGGFSAPAYEPSGDDIPF